MKSEAEGIINRQLHHEIELRKQIERQMQDALEYSRGIVDTVREPLLVLDADLSVISANPSFYRAFNVKPEDTEKQHIYDLGNRQWNIPQLRELLENILPKTSSFDNFEVVHDFPDIGRRIMLLNARQIHQKASRTKLILLALEDITERKELEEKLRDLASHDELTGCLNFRAIMEILENEVVRSRRYQKTFSVIMIDIDRFKRINDEYGHLAGNDALVAFAGVLKDSVRSIDSVGRYGGEEFLIVLPEADPQHALVVLERVRHNLEQVKDFTLKFSAGIAVFPHNAKDLKELIWVADSALHQAKQEGGDRAEIGTENTAPHTVF
jgi:diguanylate cyclase (GGDEF)-like protein/PAS domain S-box-containing protein